MSGKKKCPVCDGRGFVLVYSINGAFEKLLSGEQVHDRDWGVKTCSECRGTGRVTKRRMLKLILALTGASVITFIVIVAFHIFFFGPKRHEAVPSIHSCPQQCDKYDKEMDR